MNVEKDVSLSELQSLIRLHNGIYSDINEIFAILDSQLSLIMHNVPVKQEEPEPTPIMETSLNQTIYGFNSQMINIKEKLTQYTSNIRL